jgi:hypothetical protein
MNGRRDLQPWFSRSLTASFLLLCGCALGPNWASIAQQARQIQATCTAQHLDSASAAERCSQGPIRSLYVDAGFLDLDVIDSYLARRAAIAAEEDRHAISPETARAEYAEALAQQNTMLQQRVASRAQISAARGPLYCNRVTFGSMVCH